MPQTPSTIGGVGLFGQGLNNFYSNKSVLPSWKFVVYITNDDDIIKTGDNAGKIIRTIIKRAFKTITYHHILDVTIPLYKYQTEVTKYGPVAKTFPTINHEGFNLKITYEDDKDGNVLGLIHHMQQQIVDKNGFYKRLNMNKIGDINIHLYNDFGINVAQWVAKNAYFLGAEDLSLSYTNDGSMKYGVNYGCDIITFRKFKGIPSYIKDAANTALRIKDDIQALKVVR